MRRLLAAVAIIAGTLPVSAAAQTANANEKAYTVSLICAVVASQSKNDADIQRTMDAVRKMGRAQGYDGERIASDLTKMAGALGVERRSDPNAAARDHMLCRRMKLIS